MSDATHLLDDAATGDRRAAAEAMRRVLVDHARNRDRPERGDRRRFDLDRLTDLAGATGNGAMRG
jgi:hypothetical protein